MPDCVVSKGINSTSYRLAITTGVVSSLVAYRDLFTQEMVNPHVIPITKVRERYFSQLRPR
jgi:hypothetical protein